MAASTPVIALSGVSKVYRDFWLRPQVAAVTDLTLAVEPGWTLGLLGPNGSGKSTTIKMVLGLLNPTRGRIQVLGQPADDVETKTRVGYLPEESTLYRFLNAQETLDFYGRLFHLPRTERRRRTDMLLDMVGLANARFRTVAEYSKGMLRRLGLAQALINDPDLLVLDEPTSGMDPPATRQIKDLLLSLRRRGKTIVLCTHSLDDVEDVASHLAVLYAGRLRASGTLSELLSRSDRLQVEMPAMPQGVLDRIQGAVREISGHADLEIRPASKRLESLFMDIIAAARNEGLVSSGASNDGRLAGFLSGDGNAASDLDRLVAAPQAAAVPAPTPANEPDQNALGQLAPSATGPVPAVAAKPAVDDGLLDSLTQKP